MVGMRVVKVPRFGGPEMLVPSETADPVARPGEVVVDVSVVPSCSLKRRSGVVWVVSGSR